MKLIDLSHPLKPGMPVFPGMVEPQFRDDFTVETHGFAEKHLAMHSHTGTHIDAPAHMLAEGLTLDQFPVDQYLGRGLVLDVRVQPRIDLEFLKRYEAAIAQTEFLLFCTGWDMKWGQPDYFSGFPALDSAASAWLSGFALKGVGVDAISIDAADAKTYVVHHNLLSKPMVVIENCRGLDRLIGIDFFFSCLPLAIVDADGSPVRAVAWIGEE